MTNVLEWFVYYETICVWKIRSYIKAVPSADVSSALHSLMCLFPQCRLVCPQCIGSLPESRAFTLCHPTPVQAAHSFSHDPKHSCPVTAPMTRPCSHLPLPCAAFCAQDTHCQSMLLPPGASASAGPGVYVFTVFFCTYQFGQTELESFCT